MEDIILDEIPNEKELEYAGFWVRILAMIADFFILLAIMFVLAIVFLVLGLSTIPLSEVFSGYASFLSFMSLSSLGIFGNILSVVFTITIATMFDISKWHGTPGKHFCGVQITEIKTNEPISLNTSILRNVIKNSSSILALVPVFGALSGLAGIVLFFGFFACAFTSKKQALHDILAGTTVTYRY